jgi:hypothetical protein
MALDAWYKLHMSEKDMKEGLRSLHQTMMAEYKWTEKKLLALEGRRKDQEVGKKWKV